jgi:hypothetical protein
MSGEKLSPVRFIHCTKREVELRNRYAYGLWTCPDGRQVLFDRNYKPMWQRYLDQPATPADPSEWVLFAKEEWFFGYPAPWTHPINYAVKQVMTRCEAVLAEWGVQNAPSRGTFVRVSRRGNAFNGRQPINLSVIR